MKDKKYLYDWYNATSTDDGTGEIETYENWLERQLISRIEKLEALEKANEQHSKHRQLTIPDVIGSLPSKTYEIDFGGNLKCKIRVCGNELEVEAAMNGWGNGIPCSEISMVELQ